MTGREPPANLRRRRRLANAVRAVAWAIAALVLLQAALAGHLLAGNATARTAHEFVAANAIMWLAAVQIVAAVLLWRPARGPLWPAVLAVAVFGALLLQLTWGYHGRVALHVPTGVALLAVEVLVATHMPRADRTAGHNMSAPGPPLEETL